MIGLNILIYAHINCVISRESAASYAYIMVFIITQCLIMIILWVIYNFQKKFKKTLEICKKNFQTTNKKSIKNNSYGSFCKT